METRHTRGVHVRHVASHGHIHLTQQLDEVTRIESQFLCDLEDTLHCPGTCPSGSPCDPELSSRREGARSPSRIRCASAESVTPTTATSFRPSARPSALRLATVTRDARRACGVRRPSACLDASPATTSRASLPLRAAISTARVPRATRPARVAIPSRLSVPPARARPPPRFRRSPRPRPPCSSRRPLPRMPPPQARPVRPPPRVHPAPLAPPPRPTPRQPSSQPRRPRPAPRPRR